MWGNPLISVNSGWYNSLLLKNVTLEIEVPVSPSKLQSPRKSTLVSSSPVKVSMYMIFLKLDFFWAQIASLVAMSGPKKVSISGPTPSNGPCNESCPP